MVAARHVTHGELDAAFDVAATGVQEAKEAIRSLELRVESWKTSQEDTLRSLKNHVEFYMGRQAADDIFRDRREIPAGAEEEEEKPRRKSGPKQAGIDYGWVMKFWNEAIVPRVNTKPIVEWTKARKTAIRNRLRQHPDLWDLLLVHTENLSGWHYDHGKLTIDLLMSPQGFTQLIEGYFHDATMESRRQRSTAVQLQNEERARNLEAFRREYGGPGEETQEETN